MNNSYTATRLVFLTLSGLALLFLVAPIIGLFFSSNLPDLFETMVDNEVRNSISLTLLISALTTLILSIFALPLSYILARKDFFGKTILLGLIDLPIVIPHSAAGIALLGLISRDSVIGKFGELLGLNLVGSPFAIGLAMGFVSLPFLINSAKDGFEAVPLRIEQAAKSLGASPFKVFTSISIPLANKSIISGLVLMFARGMSEFGAIVIVAYHPMTAPVLIFDRFNSYGLAQARPVAIIFVLICVAVFVLFRLLGRDYDKKGR